MPERLKLRPHQQETLKKLRNGSILCGGVGSGKSLTAIAYFWTKELGGDISYDWELTPPLHTKDLYIITTARKRDELDWERECSNFMLSTDPSISIFGIKVVVDSWNNIQKYKDVKGAFFIFDEQRVVGSGKWSQSFIKIAKANRWILLSATPGDTWMDYIPVFIANGFYKNRTEFIDRHVVYSRFSRYPKVERYLECAHLVKLKKEVLVNMDYEKKTIRNYSVIKTKFNKRSYEKIRKTKTKLYSGKPCRNASELIQELRKVVNSDSSKVDALYDIFKHKKKAIVFYNFDYELDILIETAKSLDIRYAQWNGHQHDPIPDLKESWLYFVQYAAGAEGWNCIKTDTVVFFSPSYSYKVMEQACGRIDRMNTPYKNLHYYILMTDSTIDQAIMKALKEKRKFNESEFVAKT